MVSSDSVICFLFKTINSFIILLYYSLYNVSIDWRNQDKWPKLYNALFKVVEIYKPYAQKNKKLEKQAYSKK